VVGWVERELVPALNAACLSFDHRREVFRQGIAVAMEAHAEARGARAPGASGSSKCSFQDRKRLFFGGSRTHGTGAARRATGAEAMQGGEFGG
jgi:hypothetical protein